MKRPIKKERRRQRRNARTWKIVSAVIAVVLVVAMGLGMFLNMGIQTNAAGNWISDPDTHNSWYTDDQGVSAQGGDSTRNTGRVWTDKSVYTSDVELTGQGGETTFEIDNDDGTALVGLSALSSAANISGQTTINQPLDIVLVLDRSGSMDDGYLTSTTYTEEYDIETDWRAPDYYVQNDDGTYTQVERRTLWGRFSGWYLNDVQVYPMTSATDANPSHIQFYTAEETSRTRIDTAMENAVTNFINTVAQENVGKDQSQQHRVAIVDYASNVSSFNAGNDRNPIYFLYCTQGNNQTRLTSYVKGLTYNGGTEADLGFERAQNIINGGTIGDDWWNQENYGDGAREEAQTVVIFFTDGMPGDGQRVENDNAGTAVNTSYAMKQDGVTVYSIGVFQGADPSDLTGTGNTTHDANYFMNAVSSNYPNATSTNTDSSRADFSENCTLGNRADGNYYYAASDAEALNEVFQSIYDDFGTGATSPIETTNNIGGQPVGYLTFTDTLGDYMEVKNLKSIVFAGQKFDYSGTQPSASKTGETEYHFSGEVKGNDVYPGNHNLNDIIITINKSDNPQTGDRVTVEIPSSLVPLRLYTAETETVDGETTTTTSVTPAYPIRVYYTVGLKSDIMDGDNIDASQLTGDYIASHTDEDGNVYFLSNDYKSGDAGTTTATFTPADTNSFYYFTEDTPIYASENVEDPAKSYESGQTYYYQRIYYAENEVQPEWVSFVAADDQLGRYVQFDSESRTYYIEADSPRLTRATEFDASKTDNTTQTAKEAIEPRWDGSQVVVYLGNNGKIAYPVSGSIRISKAVDWADTGVTHNDKDFTYTVDLGEVNGEGDPDIQGSFDYIKYDTNGQALDAEDKPQEITEGGFPAATGQIRDGDTVELATGEYVVISGLPANTDFTVTETEEDGYTPSNTVEGEASTNGAVAEGTIVSNDTIEVAYTNVYSVSSTELSANSISGTKTLQGRDWKENESFTFTLTPITEGAPLPEGAQSNVASVTLSNSSSNDYTENEKVNFGFGAITFSQVGKYVYLVQETEGEEYGLAYSNAVYRVTVNVTDDGAGNLTASIESIYRTFSDNGDSTGENEEEWPKVTSADFINGFGGNDVDYANITGKKAFTDSTSDSTLDINDFYFNLTPVTEGAPMPDETSTGNLGTGAIEFSDIEFDIDDVGKTYEYQVTEDIPQEALENGTPDDEKQTLTYQGMNYDTSSKTVKIAVTQDETTGSVIATVTGNGFEFTNSYRASSVTTEGASDGLQITKQLDGAAGTEGQFTFTMVAADTLTVNAINNGWVTGIDADGNVETSPTIEKDGTANILFDNLTFTHKGTYTFKVTEEQNAPNNAWSYDSHTYNIRYTVSDQDGKLVISDKVIIGSDIFKNSYKAYMDYDNEAGGILISKTLNGRDLAQGQFNFTVSTPDDDAVSAEKLEEATTAPTNPRGGSDGTPVSWQAINGLTFDQNDVGQTFTFIISENDAGASGYTYDKNPVTVAIKVSDDGDGSLSTVTTVTKNDRTTTYDSSDFASTDPATRPTAPFENSYTASETDAVSVNFEKQLTGRDWKNSDNFEFTLTADIEHSEGVTDGELEGAMPSDTIESVSGDDEEKTFTFGDFVFSKAGTYAYAVSETQPTEGDDTQGVTYDSRTATVYFYVTDNGSGKLQVSTQITGIDVDSQAGAGIFVNTYKYTPVTLKGTDSGLGVQKIVTGAPNSENFSFTATFNSEDGNNTGTVDNIEGLNENNALTATISDNFVEGETKSADFGTVTFKAPGVYVFDVTEDNETPDPANGWTYDDTRKQIIVTVTDNTEGELVATTTYNDTETNDPVFTNSYAPNSVTLSGDSGLKATKSVTGAPATEEFMFNMKLTSDNAGNVKVGSGETETSFPQDGITMTTTSLAGREDATETVNFGDLTFTAADIYTFTVTETTTTDADGWTYGTGSGAVITVTVTDDYDGQLKATTMVTRGEGDSATQIETNNPIITNSYAPGSVTVGEGEASGPIEVTKNISGAPAPSSFSFTLTFDGDADGNTGSIENITGLTEGSITTSVSQDSLSDNTETASFGDLTFTAEGDYYFTVTENETAPNSGWTYDNTPKTVIVHVTDTDHDGYLEARVDDDAAVVNNSYSSASVTVGDNEDDLQVTKKVTGAAAPGEFKFTLQLMSDNAATVTGLGDNNSIEMSTTELTDKEGDEATETVNFGDLTFAAAGDYIFTVTETTTQPNPANGWTYDNEAKTITVHVTDENYDGQLDAKVEGNNPIVTNSYDHGTLTLSGDTALKVQKTVTGAPTDVDFTFTATFDVDASKVAAGTDGTAGTLAGIKDATDNFVLNATVSDDFAEGADPKTASFGDITFTQPGTYVFDVAETNAAPTKDSGWTYDNTTKTITVVVTDNGEGALVPQVTYGNNVEDAAEVDTKVTTAAAFTNSYKADSVTIGDGTTAGINVQKTLTGRDWQKGDIFTFTLAAQDNAPMPGEDGKSVTITNRSDPKSASFGSITYDTEGTYTYTVTETVPNDADKIGGITYDTHSVTVTVSVTDTDHDGKLEASISYDNKEGTTDEDKEVTTAATFTNTYAPGGEVPVDPGKETEGEITLTKVLKGKAWDGDAFTFEITAKDEASKAYMPANTKVTVSDPDGKNADGNDIAYINFDEITFDKEGTFTYEVREIKGDNPGMTYSSNVATITINVSDNLQGGYTAVVNISNSTFTNVYSTEVDYDAHAAINLTKVLSGHDMEAGQFKFNVKPKDQESADKLGIDPNGLTLNSPAAAKGDKAVMSLLGRNNVTFTQEDSGKTYSYIISEQDADKAPEGYKYDGDVYTLTIKVSDDGDGTLSVVTTVSNGEDYTMSETVTNRSEGVTTMEVPFTNTYNATGTLGGNGEGAVKLNATKELTNRDQVAGEFKFNVTNSREENGEPVVTGTNAADGTVTFDPIEYTTKGMLEDVANGIAVAGKTEDGNDTYTYQYTVAEDQSSFDDGVTAIESSFQITVTVTDNNDGTLSIAVTYPEGSNDNLTFRNAYGAGEDGTAVLNIKGAKDLDVESGNNAPDIAGKYTFELSGSEGAPMPDNTTAKNDAAGNVSFGDITYTMENVFGEAASDDSSVSEDQPAEPETPAADEAVDGNEGGSAEDTADVPADETDGTEAGAADETGSAEAEVDAQSADEAVQPEVEQQDAGEATGDNVQTTSVEPAMTGNDGISALSTVRQKTFTYTVTETGSVAGVTNDAEASKTFDVTVTDNGDGTLSVTTSEVPGGLFKFTNTYSVTPTDPTDPTNPDDSGEAAVTITKKLTGRDMTEGEFSFVLKNANGETVSEAKNAADGSVKFTGITFDTPGSYSYTISEVQGNAGGVTYDSTIYKATATVTDNSDGTLSAVWSVTDADGNAVDSIVFHNEYSYSGTTTVTLGATKALDGRVMEEGEFNFLLKDSDGETVAKAVNSKDGAVQFDELSFDKPGTYEYTISEEKGDDATITYDDTVYNVTVTVADSGEGYLTASVDFGGETPAFTNVYTAPEEPTEEPAKPADNSNKGETPKADKIQKEEPAKTTTVQTGDSSPIMMTVIVMAAALVAIIAAIVVMFRRRNGR